MQRVNVIIALIVLIFLGWWADRFYHSQLPEMSVLNHFYPVVTYNGPDESPDVDLARKRPATWTSLSEIPKQVWGAILVSEDWAFFQHKGYDPAMIELALKEDLARGRFKRGASTLTQQVIKNVFLEKDKTLWRKLKEFILAVRLEKKVSKTRILEIYLNIAEWGEGVFGIRAAAKTYFQKSPSQLTAKEGAFLAMLLPSPKRYSQSFRSKQLTRYAAKTILNILRNMGRAGYITNEQRVAEARIPLSFEAASAPRLEFEPEPDPDTPTEDVPVGASRLRDEEPSLQKIESNSEE